MNARSIKPTERKTNRKKELEPETRFVTKSLPFGGHKPGFLSSVPRQFMLFTEQIIHIIKCNLIKRTWKEKEIKSRSCSYEYSNSKALCKRMTGIFFKKQPFLGAGLKTVHMGSEFSDENEHHMSSEQLMPAED